VQCKIEDDSAARTLEGLVPDGSLTNGGDAKAKRVLGHIDDLVRSVTDSPKYFGAVAGDYADAINIPAATKFIDDATHLRVVNTNRILLIFGLRTK
jgi:hypothetical protein